MIRYDLEPSKILEVSINVNPEVRGMGFGKSILKKAIEHAAENYLDYYIVKALIKTHNRISQKIFSDAGFVKVHDVTDRDYSVWIRVKT